MEGRADGSIFGVKDGSEGPGGDWYDLTVPLPFVPLGGDDEEFEGGSDAGPKEEKARGEKVSEAEAVAAIELEGVEGDE